MDTPPKNQTKALKLYNIVLCAHHLMDRNVLHGNLKKSLNGNMSYSEYKTKYNDQPVILKIWDVLRIEDYEHMILTESNSIDGIYIIYDSINEDTIIDINKWMKLIKFHQSSVKILISMNSDDPAIKIKPRDGKAIADYFRFHFYNASSDKNKVMEDLFKIFITKATINESQD